MATIGEEVECEFVSSNVTDSTPVYNSTIHQPYLKDSKLQYGTSIFQNLNDTLIIPDFDNQNTYIVGDLSFKDGHVSIYSNGAGGIAPKMPSEYTTHDTSLDKSTWNNRYVLLGTNTATYPIIEMTAAENNGVNGSNITISTTENNGVYTYNYNATSWEIGSTVESSTALQNPTKFNNIGVGMAWDDLTKIEFKDSIVATCWVGYEYPTPTSTVIASGFDFSTIPSNAIITGVEVQVTRKQSNGKSWSVSDNAVMLYSGTTARGTNQAKSSEWSFGLTTETYGGQSNLMGWTNISRADLDGSFGVGVSAKNTSIYSSRAHIDSIQVKIYYNYDEARAWQYNANVNVIRKLDSTNILTEEAPTFYSESNFSYIPQTIIVDGTSVYARTNKNINYGTKTLNTVWEVVETPANLGFTEIGYSNTYAPLDQTNITPAYFPSIMNYKIKGKEVFNSFTLSKVLATQLTYSFKYSNNEIAKTATVNLDCKRDKDGILSLYPTTIIMYADTTMPAGSTVEISLTHNGQIQLGSFTLNNAVQGGFTELVFSHTAQDYNDYTPDAFGFIPEGTKAVVSKFNIKTFINIEAYDNYILFLESIVRKNVTIDGTDSAGRMPDSKSVFGSLIRRARITNYTVSSQVINNELGDTAPVELSVQEIL